jgi:hypothetical protein
VNNWRGGFGSERTGAERRGEKSEEEWRGEHNLTFSNRY